MFLPAATVHCPRQVNAQYTERVTALGRYMKFDYSFSEVPLPIMQQVMCSHFCFLLYLWILWHIGAKHFLRFIGS